MNNEENSLISVIIPAYNHEKFIQTTLESLIKQTYSDIEIIITNDGSTDSTHEKIQEIFPACRKRFKRFDYTNKPNEGIIKSLNFCLSKAAGNYIYIIASDDIAEPDALSVLYHTLQERPECGLAVGDNLLIDDKGHPCYWDSKRKLTYNEKNAFGKTVAEFIQKHRPHLKFDSSEFGTYKQLLSGNHIPNGYLIRKSLIDTIGGYNEKAPLEDHFLMLQLSKRTKFYFINRTLFRYRWHSSNTIKQYDRAQLNQEVTLLLELDYAKSIGVEDYLSRKVYKSFLGIPIYKLKTGNGSRRIWLLGIQIFKREIKSDTETITRILGSKTRLLNSIFFHSLNNKLKDLFLVLSYLDRATIQRFRYPRKNKVRPYSPPRLMRKQWLDLASGTRSKKIRNSTDVECWGPKTMNQIRICETARTPEIFRYILKSTIVNPYCTHFQTKLHSLSERCVNVETDRQLITNNINSKFGNLLVLEKSLPINCIPRGIFLAGNGASNYYHWLIEILPKCNFIFELDSEFENYPLLVDRSAKNYSSFQDSLKFFIENRPVIYIDNNVNYLVEELIVFTTPSLIPFNLKEKVQPQVQDFAFHRESLDYVSQRLLAHYYPSEHKLPKRIFLSQRTPRRAYNQDEIFACFEEYGFVQVFPAELSLQEQITLFRDADYIVGATGAAWTNLIFCKPTSHCLCWMDQFASGFASFSNLARYSSTKLSYIYYDSGAKSTADLYSNDYLLQTKLVLQWLDKYCYIDK